MRRIGQILVDLGFISDDQLEQLLEEQQQRPGRRLGKVAEELGYVTDEQLAQALAEQWGMQVIHLADIVVPPQVLGYVTEPMAQLYRDRAGQFSRQHADDRPLRSAESDHPGRAAHLPGI